VRVHVAAVRAQGDEAVGVLQPEVPGPRSAHRHAAEHDTVAVDVVVAADRLDRLEDVRLAGPAVAVLDPAQGGQFEGVLVGAVLAGLVALVEAGQEAQLAQPHGAHAAVQYDVEPAWFGGVVFRRHDDAARLHGAVDGGDESANDLPFLPGPGL